MFHKGAVEHKLVHHGADVNVPRDCSTGHDCAARR